MIGWARAARDALTAGPAALVTILATEGSAPRGAGTRMVVTAETLHGTIGGGRLELQATAQARALLALPPGAWRVQDYPLGPLLGQCCGGRVRLLIEHLDDAGWLGEVGDGVMLVSRFAADAIVRSVVPRAVVVRTEARGPKPEAGIALVERFGETRRPVLLFGAGHVGQAIARALAGLPFDLAWFDRRAEMAERPGVAWVTEDDLPACAGAAPADAAVLILTHDHDLDYRLTAAALGSAAGFVGLIGSTTKRARFIARLARDGIDATRLTCPIGLPDIAGKEPEVIAIAAVAQLLAMREEASC